MTDTPAPCGHLLICAEPPGVGESLAQVGRSGGYEVRTCAPTELAEEVRRHCPDLVVLAAPEHRLPGLITAARAAAGERRLPLLAALPEFSEAAAAQVLSLGADEFLVPPFRAEEVLARVAVLLKLKRDEDLLLASRAEFDRLFGHHAEALLTCDRQGHACRLNPALTRLLGYTPRESQGVPAQALFASAADQERFFRLLAEPAATGAVKVTLKKKTGEPVIVLLRALTSTAPREAVASFQVQQVGVPSPLKRALKTLVEHFLPVAKDYLALLSMTPLVGGRYEKLKKLGQGSFGEVWLVRDTEAVGEERLFVAKIPYSKAANAKFRKEAAICRKLAPHPGIIRLEEVVEDDGKVVLIQEYVSGHTLDELLTQEVPEHVAENIILQLIDVVAHAHRHRIMHRDIKPGNIIIQEDGRLKLLDYGAAKILKEKDISATMVGSRPFMAPEQIMGESELRSDIWAIGVIMYLLYTGELPFYSDNEKFLIDLILEQEPTPPRELNPDLPPELEAIILKCLKKDPRERYPSALALKGDLMRHFPEYGWQPAQG
jgi:DNA-binding response OmpR family regulator/predicted Ser/Thr protein kinase